MRAFASEVCRAAWTRPEDENAIGLLLLALQEAAANILEHAYQGKGGLPITLLVQTDADRISLTLYHEGAAFDPNTALPPAFDGSREGGFGVYMMERLTDQVRYFREPDGRCAVCLVKSRAGAEHGFEH